MYARNPSPKSAGCARAAASTAAPPRRCSPRTATPYPTHPVSRAFIVGLPSSSTAGRSCRGQAGRSPNGRRNTRRPVRGPCTAQGDTVSVERTGGRELLGIHHVTAIAGDPQENVDFYVRRLGLRLVKKSVNQDDPSTYHLFYADGAGNP